MRSGARAATALAAALLLAGPAAAQPAKEGVLDAPAPPTLPALLHRGLSYTFEYTAATLEPNDRAGNAFAYYAHNEVELPLVSRRWYVGVAGDIGAGSVPGVGTAFFQGNPELTARGVWWNLLGLSSGGALGLVLPLPRSPSDRETEVLRVVRVVRPWDYAYFEDRVLTIRPSYDIRHVTGPFVFQLRQGIDLSLVLRDPEAHERRTRLTARATFYVGYRAARPVGLGVELFEVYQLTATEVPDGKRAAFTVSPSVRFLLGRVQPALSALFPIATPLRGDVESYWGGRLNVGFDWDWALVRQPD